MKDVLGREISVGDEVAFALIGSGSNHGGAIGVGVVEDFRFRQGVAEMVVRNDATLKIIRRPSHHLIVI